MKLKENIFRLSTGKITGSLCAFLFHKVLFIKLFSIRLAKELYNASQWHSRSEKSPIQTSS